MGKFRKKPVEIEAFQLTYEMAKSIDPVPEWFIDATKDKTVTVFVTDKIHDSQYCEIKTLEGVMRANATDFIIKGIQGEIYPCKKDIFEATYDEILGETDGISTNKIPEEVDAEIKSENAAIELTSGQKAVGVSFNPSFMPEVDNVKNLFAETIDTLEANHKKNCEVLAPTWERNVFRTEAYNAVVRASSAVVKYLTWKD